MSNPTGKGGFQERKHQINRKGRPRSFDALRELAQQLAHEIVEVGDKRFTITEVILRQWAQSKNPQLQKGFLEIAYGKVPDNMELNQKGEIVIKVIYDDYPNQDAPIAPGPG